MASSLQRVVPYKFSFKSPLNSINSNNIHDKVNDEVLVFAGVKFPDPIATSLKSLSIIEPSPIQRAAIAGLTAGQSAILHAETGSGKYLFVFKYF